ncbi:MAG: TlpA disulfide reductase family protein [Acidobacteriota bacterium]
MIAPLKIRVGLAAGMTLCLASLAGAATDPGLDGRWDATLTVKDAVVPFRLDISGEGPALKGTLYNGDEQEFTTSASYKDGVVVLDLAHYLTKIIATAKDGQLDGKVEMRNGEGGGYPFHATRHTAAGTAEVPSGVPVIAGVWEIPHEKPTPKGEKAWRFIVKQSGAEASATILRVDGDTGALTGRYKDGKFVLSHFDGSRPGLMEVSLTSEGTLDIVETASNRPGHMLAYRPEVARAKGFPEPANYATHTTVRDPHEKFTFRFPDVNGKMVSSDDPKFKDKVIVAIVTGTWCPNCHDEAQYLVPLYKKYRDLGVEIVALDFEEPEQQDQLSRVKAFIRQYGVEYTYLIAGAPAEMWEQVPQAVNLNTWPATFFIGRDGLVKGIHAGFAAPASGPFHRQLKDEFTSTLDRLLKEDGTSKVSRLGE